MLATEIPFEIHITTDDLASNRQQEFVDFCLTRTAKPLMIKLSKGDFVNQPMLSKVVYATSLDAILSNASEISGALTNQNFGVKRLKVEIAYNHADLFKNYLSRFEKYFEWHGKVVYAQVDTLLEVCEKHRSHLSSNALTNQLNARFITLREFGTKHEFEQRVLALTKDLQNGNWTILKQEFEYCIYDNNNFLDNGWLPQ
jgi:hypothetical protein